MKKINKGLMTGLICVLTLGLVGPITALAATSPTLNELNSYSVLGSSTVTNTGSTTTTGAVGVSPGTAITGFPPGIAGGNNTVYLHSNDAGAISAQTDNVSAFTTLDQPCDQTFGAVDLTTTFPAGVGPGVYCSTSSFSLSGNLNLTGSGVWIFKSASTLITSTDSSVTGGDPCNVWWRVGSSATLGTRTSFIGNILALASITLNTGATLNGRALAQTGAVTLDGNVISGPTCAVPAATSATLHVIKNLINDNGGLSNKSNFSFSVNNGVAQSFEADGQNDLTVDVGTYTITEPTVAGYSTTYNNCSNLVLADGGEATCTITNNDVVPAVVVPAVVVPDVVVPDAVADAVVQDVVEQDVVEQDVVEQDVEEDVVVQDAVADVVVQDVVTAAPGFPSAGLPPEEKNIPAYIVILSSIFILVSTSLIVVAKKRMI